ncbi:TPA: hypothetical protein NR419_002614 [Listeria innocua]|nr:hypothetical protein [Listeria innocua]
MFEKKDSSNENNHTEFIEIYEDEIKRILKRNEELENQKNNAESENKQLKFTLQESLRKIEQQDKTYQEKLTFELSEKNKLIGLITQYKNNQETSKSKEELMIKLNIEKGKVNSLQELLESKENQIYQFEQNLQEFGSKSLEQELTAEKTELAEILIEARMQAKEIVKKAKIEAASETEQAAQKVKAATEKVTTINHHLEQIKNGTTTFISELMAQIDQTFD